MNRYGYARLAIACVLAVSVAAPAQAARGGGGGGGRGGGGGGYGGGVSRGGGYSGGYSGGAARSGGYSAGAARSGGYSSGGSYSSGAARSGGYSGYSGGAARSSYSGNGSIRYSGPSYSRPSTPSYARPSLSPSAPISVSRPSGYGSVSRGAVGDISPKTYTTPRGTTISGIKGPGGGGAIGIEGAGGTTAGGIKGPGGGGAAGIQGAGGTTAGGIRGPGGAGAAGIQGAGGGAAGAVRGPGGGTAAGVRGPGGAAAGGVVGPAGGGAAAVRGPAGVRGAGAVWGPNGAAIAGARGPYAGFVTARLPAGAVHYPWHGYDYWHSGFAWYSPCWIGEDVHYAWAYPPVGFFYPELPPESTTVVINDNSYYYSEGVYYQPGEQDGQTGYVVAEAPEGAETPAGEDPFKLLRAMCDYLGAMDRINVTVNATTDDVLVSGEKIQTSTQRTVYVSRPDKIAAYVNGDNGEKRLVYDGKTVSLYDRKKAVYTVIQVPDTIDAALDVLANSYGIVMPLDDILYKDAYDRLTARASAGQYLGLSKLDGADCHHLAFTTDAVDWEVWVQAGDKPLPRGIAINYKQSVGAPRYAATIAWADASRLTAQTFEFIPPGGVQRIEMPPVKAAATAPSAASQPPGTAARDVP